MSIVIKMVKITDIAVAEIKQILETENQEDKCLRIFAAGTGCSGVEYGLKLDDISDSDKVFEYKGLKIIYNPDIEADIKDYEIDYIDNDYGKGFTITNLNMRCGTGCGVCG